jgi:hypothetical protein
LDELKNGILTVCVVYEPLESVENQECIDIAVDQININSITKDSTITLQLKETEIPFGTLHVVPYINDHDNSKSNCLCMKIWVKSF